MDVPLGGAPAIAAATRSHMPPLHTHTLRRFRGQRVVWGRRVGAEAARRIFAVCEADLAQSLQTLQDFALNHAQSFKVRNGTDVRRMADELQSTLKRKRFRERGHAVRAGREMSPEPWRQYALFFTTRRLEAACLATGMWEACTRGMAFYRLLPLWSLLGRAEHGLDGPFFAWALVEPKRPAWLHGGNDKQPVKQPAVEEPDLVARRGKGSGVICRKRQATTTPGPLRPRRPATLPMRHRKRPSRPPRRPRARQWRSPWQTMCRGKSGRRVGRRGKSGRRVGRCEVAVVPAIWDRRIPEDDVQLEARPEACVAPPKELAILEGEFPSCFGEWDGGVPYQLT